ncbi:MAG: hypothetical protein IMW89_20120 [Ktedonobacteraceae bacterium]|nr:hypothetical protein [Ktedonobacteraceae bacterium]
MGESVSGPYRRPKPSGPPPWFKDVPGKLQIIVHIYTPGDLGYPEAQQRFSSVKSYLEKFPRFAGGDPYDIEWIDPFHGKKHRVPLGTWATKDPEHTFVDLRCTFVPDKKQ